MAYRYNPFWRVQRAIGNFFWKLIFSNRFLSPLFCIAFIVGAVWAFGADLDALGTLAGVLFVIFALLSALGSFLSWRRWAQGRGSSNPEQKQQ